MQVSGITKAFHGITALDRVSFTLAPQEITAVIGPNGAGKTTLIDVLSGFIRPDAGGVTWDGETLTGLKPPTLVGKGITRTFQSLRLAYSLSALENVLAAIHAGRRMRILPREASARSLLARVGLDRAADVPASALSFGMQKSLALACALGTDPDVLLLDEPFGGLHPLRVEEMGRFFQTLRVGGLLILFIEHDIDAVRAVADRVVVLAKGQVVLDGPTNEILSHSDLAGAYLT